jgi:hypothetical protein
MQSMTAAIPYDRAYITRHAAAVSFFIDTCNALWPPFRHIPVSLFNDLRHNLKKEPASKSNQFMPLDA